MSYFEKPEIEADYADNLDNNPKFTHLEELAVDPNMTPDQIAMMREENTIDDVDERELVDLDSEDLEDELTQSWEADIEPGGKYYDYQTERSGNPVETHPVPTQSRGNFVEIEKMKGREQMEKYWDAQEPSDAKNSKPKRPQDNHDSIRFLDEAI
jgi:hypothetical protein